MKTCFIICPLGKPKSETRIRADAVLNLIIKPVLSALDYGVERADITADHQWTIPESISKHIFEDNLVIADLTESNANVFYELGKRHAWGGHTIHLTNDLGTLPFDVRHHRVIKYDLQDPERLDEVRKELRLAIVELAKIPVQCPFPLTPDKVIALSNATILVERVDTYQQHYYIAEKLAKPACKRIFLMQRSSSLILGPELNWAAEETFYKAILRKIEEGSEFFHVISLEGILRHLQRPQSLFPHMPEALGQLSRDDAGIGVRGPKNIWYIKRLPNEEDDADLKPDRQARTFLVEYPDGEAEGVIVVDLGGKNSCFHLRGPMMADFLRACLDFYGRCPLLKWADLDHVLPTLKPETIPELRVVPTEKDTA